MTLPEAIKAAKPKATLVTRESWGVVSSGNPVLLAIQPTDSPDRCIYHGYADVQSGWRPTKSDLVAEDWILVNALGRQDTH